MKRILVLFFILVIHLNSYSQIKFRYGLTAGLNISTAILPDLKLNTNINSILNGDDVVQGQPQLADYVAMYKFGVFIKLDGAVASFKLNLNYDKTNIHKDLNAAVFTINALDINLGYIDLELTGHLNIFKHFYISAGYIPALLIEHQGNLNINDFDERLLGGFGFRFSNGITLDFDAIVGLSEIIDGSYIHNVMIPITINIPLN